MRDEKRNDAKFIHPKDEKSSYLFMLDTLNRVFVRLKFQFFNDCLQAAVPVVLADFLAKLTRSISLKYPFILIIPRNAPP